MRPGILAVLLLPLLAGPGEELAAAPSLGEVELRVRRGRIRLALGREITSRSERDPVLEIEGPCHFEVGPRSEVELAWRGAASLRVRGAASFGIQPRDEPSPRIAFLHLESLEIEVRRGAPRLVLPEDWTLVVPGGAVTVRELPAGDLEVKNHGGAAVAVESRTERSGDWPDEVPPGARIRLPAR